jgi:hypothetical protein
MADEVRLIDAELLTTNIAQIAKNCARSDAQKALIGRILFMIENMQTIEAITREQFAEAAKQLMNEFTANDGYGTSASATFLALCFGNLELRLFKREDGDNDGKD